MDEYTRKKRDKRMAVLYREGRSARKVAEILGMTEEGVRQALTRIGVERRGCREASQLRYGNTKRNAKIIALIGAGYTYGEVARRLEITRCTVAGCVHRNKKMALANAA